MTNWRKSSRSGDHGGECVELAALPAETVGIRDSKNPDGSHLVISRTELHSLLERVRSDDLA